MPEATTPVTESADDTTLSFDQGVDDITNLLEDPETDLSAEDQAQANAEGDPGDEPDPDAEATAEDDQVEGEADDGSEVAAQGKFVSRDAKVRLDDGTVITVGDLARNNLYQRDYTRKTQEHAENVKTFDAQRQEVGEYARTLNAQRDFLLQVAQQFLPQKPDKALIGQDIFKYQEMAADYEERMGLISQLQQHATAEQARAQQEAEAEIGRTVQDEATKLTERMPELAQKANYDKFMSDAAEAMSEYGFTAQDIAQAIDHRFYLAMRDLIKYRKARQQAPKVQQDVQAKPKLMPGSRRMDPKAKTTREQQTRAERLRQTGRMSDAVASLMDLDL